MSFIVTKFHIALAKRTFFTHYANENAASVDQNRPYGNSDIMEDLAEIYLETLVDDYDGKPEIVRTEDEQELILILGDRVIRRGDELTELLNKTQAEMVKVYQILTSNLGIREGEYIQTRQYDALSWRHVEDVA